MATASSLKIPSYLNTLKLYDDLHSVVAYGDGMFVDGAGYIRGFSAKGLLIEQLELDDSFRKLEFVCLEACPHLKSLCISAELTNLRKLEIFNNKKLETVSISEKLTALKYLNLRANNLESLKINSQLAELRFLDLSGQEEKKMKELVIGKQFPKLQYLYCKHSGLEDLLLDVSAPLEIMDLSFNAIKNFPDVILEMDTLQSLYVGDNVKCENIPQAFIGKGPSDEFSTSENQLKGIQLWLRELKLGKTKKNKEVKLIISGNGVAGKTSTLSALKSKDHCCRIKHRSTHAINIESWKNSKDYIFNVWDFGGQEVYHETHRLFMTQEAVQLILVDEKSEKAAKEGQKVICPEGKAYFAHPLEYWFQIVAGAGNQYVVAQNKMDENPRELVECRDFIKNEGGEFLPISAIKDPKSIRRLRTRLEEAAEEIPLYDMEMPKSWLNVRKFFKNNVAQKESIHKLISTEKYEEICDKAKVTKDSNVRALLRDFLHCYGYLYYHRSLGIIADQRWALAAIYVLFDRSSEVYIKRKKENNWKISIEDFSKLLETKATYTVSEVDALVGFMIQCKLCFYPTIDNNGTVDETILIFPEFFPEEPSVKSQEYQETEDTYSLQIPINYFDRSFILKLIQSYKAYTEISSMWRMGLLVGDPAGWFKAFLTKEAGQVVIKVVFFNEKLFKKLAGDIFEKLDLSSEKAYFHKGLSKEVFQYRDWTEKQKNTIDEGGKHEAMEGISKVKQLNIILFFSTNTQIEKLNFFPEIGSISQNIRNEKSWKLSPFPEETYNEFYDVVLNPGYAVIHFSGHGSNGGLHFKSIGNQAESETITKDRLTSLFHDVKKKNSDLSLVFLNACNSAAVAEEISSEGIYVIGTNVKIYDDVAWKFSACFYGAFIKNLSRYDLKTAIKESLTYAIGVESRMKGLISLFYDGIPIEL